MQLKEGKIEGVEVKELKVWPTHDGWFCEVIRGDDKLFSQSRFGQLSLSQMLPGTIKAFHAHKRQTDYATIVSGTCMISMIDKRKNSSTYNVKQVLYTNEAARILVKIPPGVAHGYKALGSEPVLICYYTDKMYLGQNRKQKLDEIRYPHDLDGFSWDYKPD